MFTAKNCSFFWLIILRGFLLIVLCFKPFFLFLPSFFKKCFSLFLPYAQSIVFDHCSFLTTLLPCVLDFSWNIFSYNCTLPDSSFVTVLNCMMSSHIDLAHINSFWTTLAFIHAQMKLKFSLDLLSWCTHYVLPFGHTPSLSAPLEEILVHNSSTQACLTPT